ncbi:RagB/SusD family nutrient uptake outer membrane protein [Arcticibacter sp. MXS-1]|uniref:RagB/SusD family nutrient uptake outer membrane protein n=1 Tax=Arcticibacter sp. MXS-1 TaxID=3341726 RepID=UPI0035A84980
MKKIYYIFVLAGILSMSSCEKFLDEVPLDEPTTGSFLKTKAEMNAALTGVYNSINWNAGSIPYQINFDNWTDIGVLRAASTAEGAYDASHGSLSTIWNFAYITIQRANTMISGMEAGKANVAENEYNRMQAEARVLRAFSYYYLVFMFGDVPLITTPLQYDEYYNQVKTPKADIIQFLYKELDESAAMMTWSVSDRGRLNKAVALGLKARIALTNGDFEVAATAAKSVIDNAGLSLNPRFEALFTRSGQNANAGKEIMFELMYSDAVQNSLNYIPLGQGSRNLGGQSGRFPTQRLVDNFEATDGKRIDESSVYDPSAPSKKRDKRLKYTVVMHGDTLTQNNAKAIFDVYNTSTKFLNASGNWVSQTNNDFSNAFGPVKNGVGYLWAKYTFNDENITIARVSWIFMRYAEILLTYAEAKIELNQVDASVISAMNALRKRAGLPDVEQAVAADQAKMRQVIRRERTSELALEGFRWFDIRRWKIAELVMPGKVYGASKTAGTVAAIPNFKTSATADLNNIGNYSASDAVRFSRDNRNFEPRHYIFPIPQSEIDRAEGLVQNELWR